MTVFLSPSYTQRSFFWTDWKAFCTKKNGIAQYDDDDGAVYTIWFYDGPEVFVCTIWKGAVPDGVQAVYSQVQNDADKTDFETNYKAKANTRISYEPTKLLTIPLKNGSSSNLAVNGSVTPQVFSYTPGANYDVEIQSACLVVETANALAFGNKFIDTTIGTLANGLLLEVKSNDDAATWQICKRTRDVVELAVEGGLNIITGTPNMFHAHFRLPEKFRLYKQGTFSTDDYIKATVRDDLRAITYMEMFLSGVKL
jgi:hypothetical protein